jgi:hypothetical protein
VRELGAALDRALAKEASLKKVLAATGADVVASEEVEV